jgi:hypothetical protein
MGVKLNPFTGNFDLTGNDANPALSNLASVAINTSLISDTDSTDDLGSSSKYWANGYIDKIYLNATATLDGATGGKVGLTGILNLLNSTTVQLNGTTYLNMTTEGKRNIGIGIGASNPGNVTGNDNVAIGGYNQYVLTSGTHNLSVGGVAMRMLVDGSQNTAFGSYALYANISGDNNVAIGFNALKTTTASSNLGLGVSALYNTSTGERNVAIGENALITNTTNSYSVAIGYNAGFTNNAGGGVYIGYNAGYYETGANKLFIDNAIRTNEADGRAKALIYGVFAAATADQDLTVNADLIITEDLDHNGSAVGFYGTAPIAQAVLATGAGATVDNVITALQNLGLVKQS